MDTIGKTTVQQDFTIDGCIRRGAIEEILGNDYDGPVNISIHAFQLETSLLNFGFLGIVDLPDLSFKEILELWPTADDANEHDVFVAMPLQGDLIRNCLASARLPDAIFPLLQRSANFEDLKAEDNAWHPTSLVRLALALWMSEQ